MGLRIALTHAFSWPEVRRGGERYMHELASALARRGHNVTILAGAKRPSVSREDGVRVVRVPRGTHMDAEWAESRFGKIVLGPLVAGRYDVVHSLGPRDAVASLQSRQLHRRRRTVYTCLGNPEAWFQDSIPTAAAHFRIVDEIDVYGCLSRFSQQCLREGYGRSGALTPGGVRLDRFRPAVERAPVPTLLYSGALNESRKGVAELLEAVAVLARSEPRVRLWLSGPGDASALLAAAPAAARERTEVLPLGSVDDQPARYAAAWVTVLPSRYEPFGLVLVESLACGTPIVGGDHGSLPELVEPGIGVLGSASDPEDLARACGEALELAAAPDIRDRTRTAARRHGWDEAVAPKIEALYLSDGQDEARPPG